MKKYFILSLLAVALLTMNSCTVRLVDFTVISSKNVGMRAEGKMIEAKEMKPFGINATIKGVIDKALETAGPEYDLLVDGVLSYSNFTFVAGYKVKGKAVNSADIKLAMTDAEFDAWYAANVSYDKNSEEVVNELPTVVE
jgi:hypothetical protein